MPWNKKRKEIVYRLSNLSYNIIKIPFFSLLAETVESKCQQINEFRTKAGRHYQRVFSWSSIDTKGLTKEHLKTLYRIKGFKELPDITQIENTIIIQYKDKAPIVLDLDKGQILIPKSYEIKSIYNQLEKVIRVLRIDDRVNSFHVATKSTKNNVPFLE